MCSRYIDPCVVDEVGIDSSLDTHVDPCGDMVGRPFSGYVDLCGDIVGIDPSVGIEPCSDMVGSPFCRYIDLCGDIVGIDPSVGI